MIPQLAPPIRFSVGPSRALFAALLLLMLAALWAVSLSALPHAALLAVPLLGALAWRGLRRGLPLELVLRSDGTAAWLDAQAQVTPLQVLALHERGPLGVLVVSRNGRREYLPWADDSLPRPLRREIRLWLRRHAATLRDPAGRVSAASSTGM